MNHKLKLDVSYIGTDYQGFQSQSSKRTVQDILEKAFSTVLREPIQVHGASRTDSGVHGEKQVAVFSHTEEVDRNKLLYSINGVLPRNIRVLSLSPVANSFNPIRDARAKIYRYKIWHGSIMPPFLNPYCWSHGRRLNVASMSQGLERVKGTHDFSAFCNVGTKVTSRVRTVYDTSMHINGDSLEIWILGGGFLKQMVRIIVGTLVEIGHEKRKSTDMQKLLISQKRELSGVTAPALGLSLIEVFYDHVPDLSSYITSYKNTGKKFN